MFKMFKRANLERRRIRWASDKKTWMTFLVTFIVIALFTTIIALFTWGMTALFNVLGA